jgi:2-C-methyl-D-erythritol 4-phosphate cytidylyltransferase / 2-C-methyl-D-erythritol 2,4-cyclodiphosphate synthase
MVCAVVVAAGRSTRMGGVDKTMLPLAGKPVLRRCLEAFESCCAVDYICLVTAPDRLEACEGLSAQWGIAKLRSVVVGGETRTISVYNGLKALPAGCEVVAIQDGARPFTTADIIVRSIESAKQTGSGVAAISCRDTVKVADGEGLVLSTPDRGTLRLVQTPQTFRFDLILQAYEKAMREGVSATDDAAIAELAGEQVHLIEGSTDNIKITTPEDIRHGEAILYTRGSAAVNMRVGEGYDVHRLVARRALILGGVDIPHETGLLGHSDADVLVHAVMDALLGAAGLGDIGKHFPDNDDAFKGISSLLLLKKVAELLAGRGWKVGNVDATVVAQRPKIATFIPQMRSNIAECLGIPHEQVNVKATTTEKLGFEGREEGISARAVAMIIREG